jgi:chromosome segregation ATPase
MVGKDGEGQGGQLKEMQRKSRMMDSERKQYSDESQNVIRKQRTTIDKLKRDNETLKEELALETKQAMQSNSSAAAAQIAKLQDQADTYTRKIEMEKRRIDELDKQIAIMQKNILEQRKKMGGVNAAKDNHAQIQKQIKILENRLDKALVKFNEALAHNKQLRETIDNLRRERVVFDQIYKKLERELAEKRKDMAQIIDAANEAYAARDQAQEEMTKLKERADEEQEQFEQEWKELGKLIEEDRKRKSDFMKRDRAGGNTEARGDMSLDQEQQLRKKVIKGNWGIAKDKAAQQVSLEKVQSYEEAFERIKQATGITEIDQLVSTFIHAEEQNFSLFNYVNELNTDIERLEEQIAEIKGEIEKYKGQGVNTENQRKKILKDLEDKLQKTEAKSHQYDEKYQAAQKTVNALKVGIQSIFHKIGCDKMPQSENLDKTEGVTELNMMSYLGIIEQRTNEILQLYAQHQAAQQGKEGDPSAVAAILGQGPQLPAGTTQISINPPSTGDDFDSDEESGEEDEDKPLSRQELKDRAMRGLNRRVDGSKRKGTPEGGKRKPK